MSVTDIQPVLYYETAVSGLNVKACGPALCDSVGVQFSKEQGFPQDGNLGERFYVVSFTNKIPGNLL
jgi:hypothetical protein